MADNETIADIIAEMRFHGQLNIDAEQDKPEFGVLTVEGKITKSYADRLEAAHKREADSIHRAMVILAGIEMPDHDYPPKLWTALEDAYDALSDALGTDGETTADNEEAKAIGRHFVIQPRGDCAKLREAVIKTQSVIAKCMDILNKIPECGYNGLIDDVADELCDLREEYVKSALAAPPRNCDVGTAVEQESRWKTNCGYGIPNCKHCKVYKEAKNSGLVNGRYLMRCDCRFIWAQMPYEEGGAK